MTAPDGHLTSTAYLRGSDGRPRLLVLYLSRDGSRVLRATRRSTLVPPAGVFKVLVVIVRHDAIVDDAAVALYKHAQDRVNEEHLAFARNSGLPDALVSFQNTNVLVESRELSRPNDAGAVRAAARNQGVSTAGYSFVVSINLDPSSHEGGFAADRTGFVYIGNYNKWTRPLTADGWRSVANAVYHHEIAHQWGWAETHDWSPPCAGPGPFLAAPVLFGWQDVDDDGVPEIVDDTPYGRSTRQILREPRTTVCRFFPPE